jgi:hypothetical protein
MNRLSFFMRGSAILLVIATAGGCQPNKEPVPAVTLASTQPEGPKSELLQSDIAALAKRIKALELDKAIRDLQNTNAAWFDPQDPKKYAPVKSPAGPVLVVLENMEPYLDGFKITFRLGNPTSASLSGVKGKISWGAAFDVNKPTENIEPLSKQFDDPTVFAPGTWTNLTISIGPATAAQARQITIEPVFDQVSLRRLGQ